MERIPEPELMDDEAQALAYAQADFEEPHTRFVEQFQRLFQDRFVTGRVLELGCGPCDITRRFAQRFPRCTIDAVDGAEAMLRLGRATIAREHLGARVRLISGRLPYVRLAPGAYDWLISNSLLHHLHDPRVLWGYVRRHARRGAGVFIMDLARPDSTDAARALVQTYAGDEPEILRRDFYHSLRAAFRPAEVQRQLHDAGLAGLAVEPLGDRHLLVHGQAP